MLMQSKLDMGHARALLSLDGAKQLMAAEQIVQNNLSVRDAEQLVKGLSAAKSAPSKVMAKDRDVVRLQEELSQALGAVVIIDAAKNGAGTLKIRYANLDQLDDVVAKLR
jgi:ParB family chromosome partitioning protein